MERVDLLDAFSREIEVLELTDDTMIYAIDQKNEIKDVCSIEKMDLKSRQVERLISLDYTRLWESFRTYSQMPDFFYAVNVLQDYRLRLRKIDKRTWENTTDFLINPEGEIINIYSLNEDYMIITDEVKGGPEVFETYGLKDCGKRYVNVRYLYEIATAKKYPIKDSHFDSLTEDIFVRPFGGHMSVIYEAFYKNEERDDKNGESAILWVPVRDFIDRVKAGLDAGFLTVAKAGDGGFDYVRIVEAGQDQVLFRRRDRTRRWEEIIRCTLDFQRTPAYELLAGYEVPEGGRVIYDPGQRQVYWSLDQEDGESCPVICLTDPGRSLDYDGQYGTFATMFGTDWLVTTYYDQVFVKEYEYHEYVAVHDLKNRTVETFAGRFEKGLNVLVLLRSFLAL
ncbi:hypothetical protein HNP82_002176 [Catenibacillus scindens]|uniref:Uncharacterized protein n=1 Tax=Catenibacillus scindens TaxID=673271 RepID=A0A7W8HAX8_9FIRM|nr:hypothetical protein [Catenibacillus scindens]MBB5265037.1 hypothetical protein [Catenibacillus scindens]